MFAFSLVVSLDSAAKAAGPCNYLPARPGCCILGVLCNKGTQDSYWVCGYGIWNGNKCVPTTLSDCPRPANCKII